MLSRLLAAVFAISLAASAQTLTIDKLVQFIKSCTDPQMRGRYPDKQVADYVHHLKLSERLDDKTLESLEAMSIGPQTRHALEDLRDRSKTLTAAAPPDALLPPKQDPPPSSEEQAKILDELRDYALNYSGNLPDFICTQVTKRFGAPRPGTKYGGKSDDDPRWQAFDQLTMRLSYFNQKEDYHLILHNNTPTAQDYKSVGGSSSYGDFGSMLRDVFEPRSEARFEWDHWGTLRGQRVMAFAYRVPQERSEYHVQVTDMHLDVVAGYHGLVEADKKTHKIMRVTLEADALPAGYPIKSTRTILDYDYTEISGHTFLLPLKGQVYMTANDIITRNDESFHNYRKYSA
ncbi:MAG TPA: hypothetical protein VHW24_25480, partial [Bryobacteraceae bacterium]|nr:hypothetical protein [Bryobacteraceae bacterium]